MTLIEEDLLTTRVVLLPVMSVEGLNKQEELRLAHLLLSTITTAFLWHKGPEQVGWCLVQSFVKCEVEISREGGSNCDDNEWNEKKERKVYFRD